MSTEQHPIVRQYIAPGVTVNWRPSLCVHCEACIKGLPEVFDLNKRPWVDVNAAPAERIIEQVAKCEGRVEDFPYAALSIQAKE